MRRIAGFGLAVIGLGALAAVWVLWPRPQNVVLITIDTMRPDRISAYGYRKHETPNLDRLAREGTLFENAFCDVTWTTPSMASVMTGLYATRHGLRSSFQKLDAGALTLAEILRAEGRQTAAIIASYPLHSVFGLNQGFDLYDEQFSAPLMLDASIEFGPPPPVAPPAAPPSDDTEAMGWFLMNKAQGDAYRSDAEVSDRAITWLRTERRGPFFLWIHYFGPHEKPTGLTGLANIAKEQEIQVAAYDPDVAIVDAEIGRVLATLDALGLADDSVLIVHADHGQSLTEHGYFGHGRNVFDPTARIPLLVRAPDRVPPGRRDPLIARNVDILPTILALLQVQNPPRVDGIDLFAPRPQGEPSTYIETYLSATWLFSEMVDPQRRVGFRRLALRTAQWKFVINDPIPFMDRPAEPLDEQIRRRNYQVALYDLTADPAETRNRLGDHPALGEQFRQQIFDLQTVGATKSEPIELDEATRDKLKALGYLD